VAHTSSDLAGLGQGFRDSNAWLAALTNHAFPTAFYAGDAWGSFNSLMRLITGVLFGLGIVWFGYPYLVYFSPGTPVPKSRFSLPNTVTSFGEYS
jgi:hypothetical protein